MATIALTGATGFIGQALTRRLLHQGHHVKALVRNPHKQFIAHPRLLVTTGSLEDPASLRRLVEGADHIVHLAGATAATDRRAFFRANAAGTTHLTEIIERHSPTTPVLLISSLAATQPRLSDYAASKEAGESIIRASSLRWTILRPPAVYGPTDQALKPLWALLSHGLLPRVSPSNARFSLIHVDDLTEAITVLLEADTQTVHQCVEIDDAYYTEAGRGYSWSDIAMIAQQSFARPIRSFPVPYWVLFAAALSVETVTWLRRQPSVFNRGKVREMQHLNWTAEHHALWNELNWAPRLQLHDTLGTLAG